ncbi:ABC transporter ATP-binding protein [Methylobacterium sp. Leaf399]|uniref:ABC transporter ATP-binding protein n=1 Tax=unclassified Methylobacterium TaxID=2615210 RepID=UPI0006F6DA73|nr:MULTISPECIES: ABC transporter ATP-binding protein [unclassified Methylobacterium]KQP58208.1 ABC transporter ATP-binding protein [Methylobacterium sp. Leaf108]KQT10063.1 ABC transporter ATP-binding protein [Methylobacterium sp. Leaf399]KQT87232.1 ABC transporter ATP-binding protein [Methylobacterium sp. Leaf466]
MTTAPILTATGLKKEFRGFKAVNGVDLSIREGSIHALIGPNGAGKTTVFNLLTQFLKPTAGRVVYRGRDITALPPADVARLGLVRSFQISAVFPKLTALANVRVALQRKASLTTQFWRSSRVLSGLDDRARSLLADVGLESHAGSEAADLSYGRKRALEIATTLALEPDLLLLDEPMAGMAHEDIGRVSELIRTVAVGRTVLMVEHNLSVVADLCDRVTVLARGEVLAEGSYDAVSRDPRVREAYMGSEDA